MERHKEIKIKNSRGRGGVYRAPLLGSLDENTTVLTTYVPQNGERFDTIANKFYGDPSLWFVIARANKDIKGTLYPTPNKVLLIPRID